MNIGSLHVRVARKTLEALDICTFELVNIDGGALPAFSAGCHITRFSRVSDRTSAYAPSSSYSSISCFK